MTVYVLTLREDGFEYTPRVFKKLDDALNALEEKYNEFDEYETPILDKMIADTCFRVTTKNGTIFVGVVYGIEVE